MWKVKAFTRWGLPDKKRCKHPQAVLRGTQPLGMDSSSMTLPESSILRGITTGIATDRQAAAS